MMTALQIEEDLIASMAEAAASTISTADFIKPAPLIHADVQMVNGGGEEGISGE